MKTNLHSLFIVLAMLAVASIGKAERVADLSLSGTGPIQSEAGVNLGYSITIIPQRH